MKSWNVEIEMHDNADTDFKQALTTAFYLASKSYDLFICSHTQCGVAKHEEKRRLINFVFSNIQLTGKKVSYTLRCPFDIMAKMNHNEDWLPLGTTLRTESYGDVIQYGQKLKLMKVDLKELQLVA